MAAQWYFEMMGAEIGPLSGAELMDKVKLGQIQPDTLVRKGKEGKWQSADRWKGLLPSSDDELPPAPPPTVGKPATSASQPPTSNTNEVSASADSQSTSKLDSSKPIGDDDDEATYHVTGDATTEGPQPFHEPGGEYDFFQFVGYRHAITPPLYDLLCEYSQKNRMTLTKITRQALAKFLGKPELGEDKKPESGVAAVATDQETDAELEVKTSDQ